VWEKSRGNTNKFSLPDTLTFTQKDDENKLESARRLFYVGMTRAKEYLQISFAEKTNEGKMLEHSQYVEEIIEKNGLSIERKHLPSEKISEYTALALSDTASLTISKAELLDKEYIKNILENFSMSVTHLNKYLDCPLTFYYESILRVPTARNEYTAFGTVTHNVLKWLFDEMKKNNNKFPSQEEFMTEFKKQMKRQRDAFTKQQFENRLAYGEKTLPEYYNKYVSMWNKIVVTEFTVKDIEVDGVPVNGNIDKIEFNDIEVNVIDYKTGKPENGIKKLNPPSDEEPHGGDYWRQIVFYKILLDNFKRQNWKMISGEIDFIEKHEKEKDFIKKKLLVTKEDISIVRNQIKDVYIKIMNHEFTEGCGDEDCIWCNFVKANATVLPLEEIKEEVQEQ
jgi:DNA helicase-2/ATP-dependent DNA helicase PcrA